MSEASAASEAWRDLCRRLDAVGERMLGEEFPSDPATRAEGYRHLTRLLVFALQEELEFSDPDFPAFHRFDDDVVRWGGPNTDNQYQRATVDPTGTYRLSGDVTGLREVIISTPEGDMQLGRYRVFEERTLGQLEVGPDGHLEVLLSAEPHPGNWIPLHPDVDHVLVRQYVSDWDHDAVAPLRIERLDPSVPAPPRPSDAGVAGALDRAAAWVEASIGYWNDYLVRSRAGGTDNVLSAPQRPRGGAQNIRYGGGWWALDPGEALLIEGEPPAASTWGWQQYGEGWFESLDFTNRVTSLSGHQIHVDADGRYRIVVAAEDPGIQNWLDTEGRAAAMLTYRYVDTSTEPVPVAEVVPVAALAARLAATTPPFSSEQRRAQIAARQAATARRFRT